MTNEEDDSSASLPVKEECLAQYNSPFTLVYFLFQMLTVPNNLRSGMF